MSHFQVQLLIWPLLLLSLCPVLAQTPAATIESTPTFTSKVRTVLVDVTVTDKNGNPVTGLTKDHFDLFEGTGFGKGVKQHIASFEEHAGKPQQFEPPSPLPSGFFTNIPSVPHTDSINVLLLDSLNTHFEDQARVRQQMISYLKAVEPGPRLAIFTLSSKLRMVEGFNNDPHVLLSALNHQNWGGKPQVSTLLRTDAESAANNSMLQSIFDANPDSQSASAAVAALQQFMNEQQATEDVSRTSRTLEALRQLSCYLGGFPGRKNVIWFSGSFPAGVFDLKGYAKGDLEGEPSNDRGLGRELTETINMLAKSQVAVYPVSAQGLDTDPLLQANQTTPIGLDAQNVPMAERVQNGINQRLSDDSLARDLNTDAEDEIASNTGGKAFYNANGLNDALAEAVRKGSYYYSLSYSPEDNRTIGRYRHITVNLHGGHYTLAYRRGYFEEDERYLKDTGSGEPNDPLRPSMVRGLPDTTQITFKLHVLQSSTASAATAPIAGDNRALTGPATRFSADFLVPIQNLNFTTTDDGARHGEIELALVAYDHDGRPLNWLYRSIKTSLNPELFLAVQNQDAHFHEEIDIPPGENYLRAGIYDAQAENSGTIEVPLKQVKSAPDDEVVPAAGPRATSAPSLVPGPAPALLAPELLASLTPTNPRAGAPAPNSAGTSSAQLPAELQATASFKEVTELKPGDIVAYCANLPVSSHSAALAKICQFALSAGKNLPDVVCQQETSRKWTTQGMTSDYEHADVITATLRYTGGHEYDDDVRVDGKPVNTPTVLSSGAWSVGEFASSLNTIFVPSSKPEFHYVKEEKLHSARAIVFDFHVSAQNNKSFLLTSGRKVWFPDYRGRIWLEEGTSRLLRLERETAHRPSDPISRTKAVTDYSTISLPDGTQMVLPVHADVLICSSSPENLGDSCARNVVTFKNWRKFGAKAKLAEAN